MCWVQRNAIASIPCVCVACGQLFYVVRSALSSHLCLLGKGSALYSISGASVTILAGAVAKNIMNMVNTTIRKIIKSAISRFYKNSNFDVFGMYAHTASAEFTRMSTQLRGYRSFYVRVCSFVAMNFSSTFFAFAIFLAGGHLRGPTRAVWGVRWTCSTVGCGIRVTTSRFAITIKA